MIVVFSIAAVVIALLYVVLIRQSDLPYIEPVSPVAHLDERKAAIFENIRDSNFEFLMGKLSAEDYQQTKKDLLRELAAVNTEIEETLGRSGVAGASERPQAAVAETTQPETPAAAKEAKADEGTVVCPHCNARFARPMRFCGECGKPMEEAR